MAEYYQFAHSVQGYNHIKANKVCQDASGECHFEDVSIIAVADGHGSDNYIRTDRGSKFAVSAALTAIKAFVQEARENHLSTVPDSETELIQVSKNILARWYTQVENDVACEPFQPEELAKVSEKYKQRYASGQYNAKAYGTTLIAVCMTNEGWFGIHMLEELGISQRPLHRLDELLLDLCQSSDFIPVHIGRLHHDLTHGGRLHLPKRLQEVVVVDLDFIQGLGWYGFNLQVDFGQNSPDGAHACLACQCC